MVSEVTQIRQPPIKLSRDLHQELRLVALVSGSGVDELVTRAVRAYLDEGGRHDAVVGFAERARRRHRRALDLLAEPSRSGI
jgi:hypothetical protein